MSESQGLPRDKAELLGRIERSRSALERTVGRLTEDQLTAPGPGGGWSVKDHLAHLSAWERSLIALLQGRPRHETMGLDRQTYLTGSDAINAIIYERSKDRPPPDVFNEFRDSHRAVLAALAGLDDAGLFKTYSHYQPDEPGEETGAPIVGWIAGNTYEHYAEHLDWIRALVE